MKRQLLFFYCMALSIFCAAQGNINELQKNLSTQGLIPAPIELNLTLNSLSPLLTRTIPESGFRNDFCQPSFSPAEKHRVLLSPSVNFLDLTYPDIRLPLRNFYNFQFPVTENRGIAANTGNFIALNLPTRFEDIIRADGVLTEAFLNFPVSSQIGNRLPFGCFHISCCHNQSFYFDAMGRRQLHFGNFLFRIGSDLARWFIHGYEGSYVSPRRNSFSPCRDLFVPPRRID